MKAIAILNTDTLIRLGGDRLLVKSAGICLDSVKRGECPLLDSHKIRLLGHVADAWLSDTEDGDDDVLMAELVFDDSAEGRRAYRTIEREGGLGVSCGLGTTAVSFHDSDGRRLDDGEALERQNDPNLILCIQQSILNEVSLTVMPANPLATVRALSVEALCWDEIRSGEETLHRILGRGQKGKPTSADLHPDRVGDDDDDVDHDGRLMSVSEYIEARRIRC